MLLGYKERKDIQFQEKMYGKNNLEGDQRSIFWNSTSNSTIPKILPLHGFLPPPEGSIPWNQACQYSLGYKERKDIQFQEKKDSLLFFYGNQRSIFPNSTSNSTIPKTLPVDRFLPASTGSIPHK